MKIIFLSSSEIALETLDSINKNHEISAVITQKDKPKGRKKIPVPSPIAVRAEELGLKLYKPECFDENLIEELKSLNCDLFITFSFGVILRKNFFDITKYGGINIHPSMLPVLRGPSPIQSAILNGMKESGLTIQKMALKVDSGDILFQEPFEIKDEDNEITIEKKVSKSASNVILQVLNDFEKDTLKPVPQDHEKATFCKLIKKEEALIDWNDKGINIINKIRAFVKWPVAYSFIDGNRINIYKARIYDNKISGVNLEDYNSEKNGKIIFADKIHGLVIKTGDCFISLMELQKQGKKILDWKSFINGFRDLDKNNFQNGDI